LPAPPCSTRATEKGKRREAEHFRALARLTWVVALLPLPLLLLEAESVVVPRVPVRVHLHVLLPRGAGLLVILGLLLSGKAVPLELGKGTIKHTYTYAIEESEMPRRAAHKELAFNWTMPARQAPFLSLG
jgi:hypothetical protein